LPSTRATAHHCSSLNAEMARDTTGPAESQTPGWLGQVTDFLHAHFTQSLSIEAIALAAGVHPAHAIATARRVLPEDAIIATDAGNFGLWISRHFRFQRPGTFLGPTSGAMGYALPAAIAAALVHRDRAVVAFAGDGGFAMTMAELETAVREKAKVIAVVFDNERYGTIRMHQDRRGEDSAIATDLGSVDFAAIARACGARGIRVETDGAFEQALRQALANDRPTVIQLALDRGWVHPDEPFGGAAAGPSAG